jgi:hypothetical protein
MELGVSYVSAHLPQHIREDMQEIKSIGCSEVLFALQENHFEALTGAYQYGASIAKDVGIKPLAVIWGFANTFGGGRMSNILLRDAKLWRIQKDGTPLPMGCLNNPFLIQQFLDKMEICHRYGFEGVLIDEPTPQDCFCPFCQKRFIELYGKDLSQSADNPAKGSQYHEFQLNTVREYVEKVCKGVKAINPRLQTATAMMPHDKEGFERVASIKEMDVFGTDPYWLVPGAAEFIGITSVKEACQCASDFKAMCASKNKLSQMWLNCWKIPAGKEEEIYTGGKALAEIGYDSFYAWSYRAALGTNEECERPEEAWAALSKLYRELAQI